MEDGGWSSMGGEGAAAVEAARVVGVVAALGAVVCGGAGARVCNGWWRRGRYEAQPPLRRGSRGRADRSAVVFAARTAIEAAFIVSLGGGVLGEEERTSGIRYKISGLNY